MMEILTNHQSKDSNALNPKPWYPGGFEMEHHLPRLGSRGRSPTNIVATQTRPAMNSNRTTLCIALLLCQSLSLSAEDDRNVAVDVSAVKEICLFRSPAWSISFFPDGSVQAQYGCLAGDGALLPAGSVDFKALVRCTSMLRDPAPRLPPLETTSQVAFHDGTETSGIAFCLTNDVLYRYLIQSFSGKWQERFGFTLSGNWQESGFGRSGTLSQRMDKLLEEFPVFQ